jgi:predicted Fe-Mo cluster-binding NifX family protein
MKVAVTAVEPSQDAILDPRFGRAAYFVVVDTDDMSFEVIDNANLSLGGGAGIQSAQLMAKKEVKVVLTGSCGPNAHQTLSAAGIEVVVGCNGTVAEAVERFKSGGLRAAEAPNVASHPGMGGGGLR